MPTEEELEQIVCEQIDHELFTPEEKQIIRNMISQVQGPSKLKQLANETAKGGDAK